MLSFRNRANRDSGGSSESHRSTTATISPLDHKSLHASVNKSSLRGRLKDITNNIARISIPRHNRNTMSYTPDPWCHVKSNDDLLCLAAAADAQHIELGGELGGQTWPAIRKSIGSVTPSLWANRGSMDSSKSPGESSHHSSYRHSKVGIRVSQDSGRRWATIATRVYPMASRRSTNDARHSSFSTLSEVLSRQDYGPAPQLPIFAESSDFLESLSKTGLFRIFTPLCEADGTMGTAKVQDITALDDKECPNNVHPIIARRPLRLRNPNAVYSREIGAPNSKKTKEQRESSPDTPSSAPTIYTGSNSTQSGLNGPKRQRKIPDSEESQACDSSKHPVEWLDRVLETSYATRNPMSPRLCVSKATMDFLQRNRTCIFVHFPRGLGLPQPLSCYPGFRAALEDICDRFGDFYAPFAAYNAHTRVITLYTTDTAPPKHKFVDDDTAIFNLELARSAWVRSSVKNDTSDTDVTPEDASPQDSDSPEGSDSPWILVEKEDLAETSANSPTISPAGSPASSPASSEGTMMLEFGDRELRKVEESET